MISVRRRWIWAVILLGVGWGVVVLLHRERRNEEMVEGDDLRMERASEDALRGEVFLRSEEAWMLEYLEGQLMERGGKVTKGAAWQRLVGMFLEMERGESIEWLRVFWASGLDGETGYLFAVGKAGTMATCPTWRVFVLDLLGRIDPAGAFELAASALEGAKGSADEYALQLRNYAWGAEVLGYEKGAVQTYLLGKTTEGLEHAEWLTEPTRGFSEMFDLIVWADGVEMVERLSGLAGAEERSVSKPAVMVLDRMMLDEKLNVLEPLVHAEWTGTEGARAALVARADLLKAEQVQLVEYYFERLANDEERKDYLEAVPNLNFVLSDNLLSEHRFFEYATILDRLRGAQAMLMKWSADERFAEWSGTIESRLEWINALLEQSEKKATTLP